MAEPALFAGQGNPIERISRRVIVRNGQYWKAGSFAAFVRLAKGGLLVTNMRVDPTNVMITVNHGRKDEYESVASVRTSTPGDGT